MVFALNKGDKGMMLSSKYKDCAAPLHQAGYSRKKEITTETVRQQKKKAETKMKLTLDSEVIQLLIF